MAPRLPREVDEVEQRQVEIERQPLTQKGPLGAKVKSDDIQGLVWRAGPDTE